MKNYSKRGSEGRRPRESRPYKAAASREQTGAGGRKGTEGPRGRKTGSDFYPDRKERREDRAFLREETGKNRGRADVPEKERTGLGRPERAAQRPDPRSMENRRPKAAAENSRSGSFAAAGPFPDRFGAAEVQENENRLEGRNAVLEAYRSGRTVDKLFLQKDLQDEMILTIAREARKAGSIISYVPKTRLDQMSETGKHQGVIAFAASVEYAEVEDILQKARDAGEEPFIFLLDGIEDPHNLGAIIRTANLAGAHGVIITKHRSAGLTATVAKASAGAVNYTPVAKVGNLGNVIDSLKAQGIWFACADMGGTRMYDLDLKGPIGLVIGNEGEGVSRLIREKCDFIASIPMKGDIDSLNASVAAGVLAYEIVRQRQCNV